MIRIRTLVKVCDNSGARYAKCLKILRTTSAFGKKKTATVGDIILVSVKYCVPRKKVKKGFLSKALVVRTKSVVKRIPGFLSLQENAVILLDKKLQPIGTRIFGPIAKDIRLKNYNKLSTLVKFLI